MSEPLTAAQRVAIARHPQRPNITDYIQALFTDFFEQKGDRLCGEDAAILGGVALYHGRPVTVIGTRKGKTLEENLKCNFGMPNPEGYRKALRLMRQAEKFRRPILTFIDTSGAYPGLEAEAHGQGEAIARNLYEMSRLTVPVIALITGEGNMVRNLKQQPDAAPVTDQVDALMTIIREKDERIEQLIRENPLLRHNP